MATQQEIQDAVVLNSLNNQITMGEFGRDYGGGNRRRAVAKFTAMGGESRLNQLMADPVINDYMVRNSSSGGFLSGLVSGIGNFASEAGIKEGLMLAGLASGIGAVTGTPITASGGTAAGVGATGSGLGVAGVPSTVAANPIADMLGTGTGVSDFAVLNSAMSTPGAMVGGSLGNAATGLGYDTIGTAATGLGGMVGNVGSTLIDPLSNTGYNGVGTSVTPGTVATSGGTTPVVDGGVASTAAQTAPSWIDYLSTGLGLAQGLNQAFGGNSLDATQIQNMVDPFAPYRSQYAQQLNSLMSNPSSVTTLPGYQFLQQQGQQGVQRALAAQGRTVSGQELLALQEQDQGLANKFYNDQYSKLAQLSGATANPASGGSTAAQVMQGNQTNQQAGWNNLGTLAAGAVTPNNPVNRTVGGIADILGFR